MSVSNSKSPFLLISICGRDFHALLDTGSSISLIGSDVIALVKQRDIKTQQSPRQISTAGGIVSTQETVVLRLSWSGGEKRQLFVLHPFIKQSVILGRDFISSVNMVIDLKDGGWQIGRTPQILIPFVKNENLQPTHSHQNPVSFLTNVHDCELEETDEVLFIYDDNMVSCELQTMQAEAGMELDINSAVSDLAPTERESMIPLLTKHASLFTSNIGHFPSFKHAIDTGNEKPIKSHPRPMTPAKREIFAQLFTELQNNNLIEKSYSPWASNPVIVPKKNGKFRLCIDYRQLNSVTVADTYPMPRIDDILSSLAGANYISVFDLTQGFHQIEIATADRIKTAFNTPWGSWHYIRLPFGPKNGPATFQRAMDLALGELKWNIVLPFFDDMFVFSKTFEQHLKDLDSFFNKMHEHKLTLNPKKVQICKNRAKILGFEISNGKFHPDPEKLDTLKNYTTPKSVKDIQRFLGFCGYYRQFVKDFSGIVRPLTALLKKDAKFCWKDDQAAAFNLLISKLTEVSCLYLPDINKPFIIQTDACGEGLGAVLLQENEGIRTPCWFISRTLNPAEKNYSISEQECLAVIWAIKKFRGFIEYGHFLIETDHQALCWLRRIKEPTGRLARWSIELQGFNFDVRYRAGTLNRTADALSRAVEVLAIEDATITRDLIIQAQLADPLLSQIIAYVQHDRLPENGGEEIVRKARDTFVCKDNLILKWVGPRDKPWEDESNMWRIWLPESLAKSAISCFHDDILSCHLGVQKTYKKVEERFFWKNMRKDVTTFVLRCLVCQQAKPNLRPPVGFGTTGWVSKTPWEQLSVDLMGPYTKGKGQNRFLLVVVDSATKWVELFALRNANTPSITKCLEKLCYRWVVIVIIVNYSCYRFKIQSTRVHWI